MSTSFRIMLNQKNGKVALHEGYEYNIDKKSSTKLHWRCTQYFKTRCHGRMTTVGDNVESTKEHSHAPDARKALVRTVVNAIKGEAQSSNDPPRRIIRNNTKTIDAISAIELPSNDSLARRVRRIRQNIGGEFNLPKSLGELELEDEYVKTVKGDQFLLFDNKDTVNRIIIFTTHANLQYLIYCDQWHVDGTFDVTPPLFKQLYTVHGMREKRCLPLVYALTCRKDFCTYDSIFRVLKNIEPRLNPKHLMVDFEQPTINSFRMIFPQTEITGCFFHFCQCIYRRVQANGLQSIYANDVNFAQHIRCLAALAFVPVDHVLQHYKSLKKFDFFKQKLKGNSAIDIGVQNLLKYMENTWIGKKGKHVFVPGLFPLQLWNVFELTLAEYPRTNNLVEAWHNAIKMMFGISHPNIYRFIKGIKDEQNDTEILISKMIAGIPIERKNKQQEEINLRILNVVKSYAKQDTFDLKNYLFGLSSAIHFGN